MSFGRNAALAALVALVALPLGAQQLPERNTGRHAPGRGALAIRVLPPSPETNAPLDTVYDALRQGFTDADAEPDTQDGLRLTWKDRWVHVRPSGTEPIVRVIAEAPTVQEAESLIHAGRDAVERLAK